MVKADLIIDPERMDFGLGMPLSLQVRSDRGLPMMPGTPNFPGIQSQVAKRRRN